MEGMFSNTFPPLWKFQLSFIHFLNIFSLIEPPPPSTTPRPPGNSNPLSGESMDISGTAHSEGEVCQHFDHPFLRG